MSEDKWFLADAKNGGYTRNPWYAKKDSKGRPICEADLYKEKMGKKK